MGAGAGMAIEDSLVMANVMGQVYDSADIPRAFRAYDTIRRPRSQKLVATSREHGLLYDMQLPGVGDDIDLIREDLQKRLKWVWNADLEAHVDSAIKVYHGTEDDPKLFL